MKALFAAALTVSALAAGCLSPVVGAECAAGLEICDGTCVDLAQDPMHCGACGRACEGQCVAGVCDGGGGAGGGGDDVGLDPGSDRDDPVLSCDLGELRCGASCIDPLTDSEHCGACGRSCGDGVCLRGACVPTCEAPAVLCGELCVDTQTNPDHCGGCGHVCASGLCEAGACVDAAAGHVVVIEHDYRRSRTGMNRLVGNAVFLSARIPVRVSSWIGEAQPSSISGTRRAIDQVADETGGTWIESEVGSASVVPSALSEADVFLVYAQHGATDAELADLGAQWATALQSFAEAGGVVVVLDGPGDHGGTSQLLEPSGLFSASGRVEVTGETLSLADPGDSVAVSVPLNYLAERSSFALDTAELSVVTEAPEGAVVVHRVVR